MVEVTESTKAAIDLLTKIEEYEHACDCDDCNSLRTHTLPFVAQVFATHREAAAKAERDRLKMNLLHIQDALAISDFEFAADLVASSLARIDALENTHD